MNLNYMGYGFNAYELSKKDYYDFVKTFDKKTYTRLVKEFPDASEEELIERVMSFIRNNYVWLAEYITEVINRDLYNKNKIRKEDRILESFTNWVLFPPTPFIDEEKIKTNLIKNKDDLTKLIKTYFPNINLEIVREIKADQLDGSDIDEWEN